MTGARGRGSWAICRAPLHYEIAVENLLAPPSSLNLEKRSTTTEEPPIAIGSDIVAKAMKREGVTDFFYIMGAPMIG